ncbi:radical SAM protein [Prosthecomicrobium hirschii]|uniref:Pre-heme d1 synthase n=1 Tax=Prosthecodimorpha hirschii TaxID=665126 RepID=A0A0P6W3P9_9HYPH|nr:heme d1 biosynthesis radical SAM protein NirJ [Prosthecomicrobium hirschii]KPL53806.1 radical SAM protein [Prosthecomicrobium hirschii]
MFRLTHFLRDLHRPGPLGPPRPATGPVVIWNLIRRCNLLCRHCYSVSGDVHFPGEMTTAEVKAVMADLKAAGVPAIILSGGEPLMRPDLFEIARHGKDMGFAMSLSSNGALIDAAAAGRIAAAGFDYVGVSLDGIGAVHDRFRGQEGAFAASLAGIRHLSDHGVRVGLRYTMTADNAASFPDLLDLMKAEACTKFYLSHLVYAGRGNKNRAEDAAHRATRAAVTTLIETAWADVQAGADREYVTGNNDADGVLLLMWARERMPERADRLEARLAAWGGNASGVGVANIDNLGQVHPDTFWWDYSLGNVKDRPFGAIWADISDPLMRGLKQRPRRISGRCGQCRHFHLCGGNTRVRAWRLTGDPFAEDPACYLDDREIGLDAAHDRVTVTPYRGQRHEAPSLIA